MKPSHASHALDEFELKAPGFLQHLKDSGEPIVLTVNGKPALVVQDAESYQRLLDLADEARALDGIRRGLEDMQAGRTATLEEFKQHVRSEHGISI